jgi:hypothetical protein
LVCCISVGTADADAPPTSEKVNPAAPSAGTAALVTRFRFEACFTRGIVASSIPVKEFRVQSVAIVCLANVPRKTGGTHDHATNDAAREHSAFIHVDERYQRVLCIRDVVSAMFMIEFSHDNLNARSALSRDDGF